jgi:hypothetical protein
MNLIIRGLPLVVSEYTLYKKPHHGIPKVTELHDGVFSICLESIAFRLKGQYRLPLSQMFGIGLVFTRYRSGSLACGRVFPGGLCPKVPGH